MSKELEKPVKAFLCAVLGLLLSAMLGQPNSITIPVTAILVVGTGQNTSRKGVWVYSAKRVLIQIVGAVLMVSSLWAVRTFTPLAGWQAVLCALAAPLALLLFLDYTWKISPMYITSVTVSGLIILTGTVNSWRYPLIRLELVVTGALLGYLMSVWVLRRDLGKAVRQQSGQALEALFRGAEMGIQGDWQRLLEAVGQGRTALQNARGEMASLREEVTLGHYGAEKEDLPVMEAVLRSIEPLLYLLDLWGKRSAVFSALGAEAQSQWTARLSASLQCHRQVLARRSGPTARAPAPCARIPREDPALGIDVVFLGALAAYEESVCHLAAAVADRDNDKKPGGAASAAPPGFLLRAARWAPGDGQAQWMRRLCLGDVVCGADSVVLLDAQLLLQLFMLQVSENVEGEDQPDPHRGLV